MKKDIQQDKLVSKEERDKFLEKLVNDYSGGYPAPIAYQNTPPSTMPQGHAPIPQVPSTPVPGQQQQQTNYTTAQGQMPPTPPSGNNPNAPN